MIKYLFLVRKISKIEGHLSLVEKYYNEFILHSYKQSIEEQLVQRAVKATIQILYDKSVLDDYDNADEVLKDFLFTRKRLDSDQVNDNEI